MKIVAVTDIHGAYETVEQILRKEAPDIVVIGGDLTTIGTVREAEDAIRRFRSLASHLLCVAGNMDTVQHDALFDRLGVSINGRGVVIDDVGFFGVSAAPISPLHTPYEITEGEIARRAAIGFADARNAPRKVFVPHVPPYGTKLDITHTGIHVGSMAVRDFIEEREPSVVICGHIHEARGLDEIGRSSIVNCGPASKGCYASVLIKDDLTILLHQFPL